MPEVHSHAPGAPCWLELNSTNPTAAKDFYTKVFNWTVTDETHEEYGIIYSFLRKNGKRVAAVSPIPSQQGTFWQTYFATTSLEDSLQKALAAGGQQAMAPMDVFESGRFAVAVDPAGKPFGLWQAKKFAGYELIRENNTPGWVEYMTSDITQTKDFYTRVFDFSYGQSPAPDNKDTYFIIQAGDEAIGGVANTSACDDNTLNTGWISYIMVDSIDATLAKATANQGTILAPKTEIPTVGFWALGTDPQSGTFALFEPSIQGEGCQ